MESAGDHAQIRIIAQQLIEAYGEMKPKPPELHPLMKWLLGAFGVLGTAALVGGGGWLVTSVNEMQLTLARMDERMINGAIKDNRFDDLDKRLTRLEASAAKPR